MVEAPERKEGKGGGPDDFSFRSDGPGAAREEDRILGRHEALSEAREVLLRCDLLIFDSTFHGKDREKAVERKHSTCLEAAEIAKSAGVRRLALTHFSARYTSVANLVKQARSVFPETIAARDGLKVEVNYPSS